MGSWEPFSKTTGEQTPGNQSEQKEKQIKREEKQMKQKERQIKSEEKKET